MPKSVAPPTELPAGCFVVSMHNQVILSIIERLMGLKELAKFKKVYDAKIHLPEEKLKDLYVLLKEMLGNNDLSDAVLRQIGFYGLSRAELYMKGFEGGHLYLYYNVQAPSPDIGTVQTWVIPSRVLWGLGGYKVTWQGQPEPITEEVLSNIFKGCFNILGVEDILKRGNWSADLDTEADDCKLYLRFYGKGKRRMVFSKTV